MTSVVVVGAGYAGVLVARRAASLGFRVTLVNERQHFVHRIRLHQVVASTRDRGAVTRLLDLPGVEFILGRAAAVDEGRVILETGRTVRGDHVVVATGSASSVGGWE